MCAGLRSLRRTCRRREETGHNKSTLADFAAGVGFACLRTSEDAYIRGALKRHSFRGKPPSSLYLRPRTDTAAPQSIPELLLGYLTSS